MEKKGKVLLGMSGGVDSSVSAILLQEQGYEVIGATLELFGDSCNNITTVKDAKKVCEKLGIKHITIELKKEFYKYVIKDFIDSYSICETPNPCIKCNRYIKFDIIGKDKGCCCDQRIYYHKKPVKDFLVVFYHIGHPICKSEKLLFNDFILQ